MYGCHSQHPHPLINPLPSPATAHPSPLTPPPPTPQMLLSGGADRTVRLWDLGQHRCVGTYVMHAESVWGMHADEHLSEVISWDRGGCVFRTEVASGDHALLVRERGAVHALAVQVRGRGVWGVSSGGGGCVCLWVCLGMGVWKAKALDFPIPLPPLPIVHPNCAPPHSLPNAVPLPLPRLRAEPLDVVSRIRHT